jgi:hypothetical protein
MMYRSGDSTNVRLSKRNFSVWRETIKWWAAWFCIYFLIAKTNESYDMYFYLLNVNLLKKQTNDTEEDHGHTETIFQESKFDA